MTSDNKCYIFLNKENKMFFLCKNYLIVLFWCSTNR